MIAPEPASVVLPVKLVWQGEAPVVAFGRVSTQRLRAPFWEDAIDDPLEITALRPLDQLDYDDRDLRLVGAIHHMTRCGSTLVMRQFGQVPRLMPLSEPEIFAQLLDGPPAPPSRTRWRLRQLLAAHRDGLSAVADRLVMKWVALVSHYADIIADALPEVPTVYLHRDPIEVLASVERNGLGGIAAVRPKHFDGSHSAVPGDQAEVSALLIAKGCAAVAWVAAMRSVDYRTLPEATIERIAPFFAVTLTEADRTAMRRVATTHSKDPTDQEAFAGDGREKRRSVSARTAMLAERIVRPALEIALAEIQPL